MSELRLLGRGEKNKGEDNKWDGKKEDGPDVTHPPDLLPGLQEHYQMD